MTWKYDWWLNDRLESRAVWKAPGLSINPTLWRAECQECGYVSDEYVLRSAAVACRRRHEATKKHRDRPRLPIQALVVEVERTGFLMLVSCILLNRTQRAQGVDEAVVNLGRSTNSPFRMAGCGVSYLSSMIARLGMAESRAETLIRFASDFGKIVPSHTGSGRPPQLDQVKACYGIGPYALDAWRIFMLRDYTVEPQDRVLQDYLESVRAGGKMTLASSPLDAKT